ncbi:MAG: TIGR00153 family protein [Vampirovibrionia bacterium]
MRGISGIFRQSPFGPIQEHMEEVSRCVSLLRPLFEAVSEKNYDKVNEVANKIIETENDCDKKKNSIRNNLPKEIFLPVSRRDLLQIINAQDSIADTTEDIANLLILRKTEIPESLNKDLFEFLDIVIETCDKAKYATDELVELFKSSFSCHEVDKLKELLKDLENTEAKTEELGRALAKNLFKIEEELNPISVMFLFKTIEEIGRLADFAKKMGNRVRMLIAK